MGRVYRTMRDNDLLLEQQGLIVRIAWNPQAAVFR